MCFHQSNLQGCEAPWQNHKPHRLCKWTEESVGIARRITYTGRSVRKHTDIITLVLPLCSTLWTQGCFCFIFTSCIYGILAQSLRFKARRATFSSRDRFGYTEMSLHSPSVGLTHVVPLFIKNNNFSLLLIACSKHLYVMCFRTPDTKLVRHSVLQCCQEMYW